MASLLDLFVKIGAKDEASGTIEKVASGAKTAFKAIGAAVGAAATAVGTLTKSAVSAYADYEQLVGGVETLFGAGGKSLEEYAASVGQTTEEASAKYDALMQAQQNMMDNANKAYLTAGLSANDYMETVTGFSAALVSSLAGDTVKAAEYANMALVDMSDNANKMGTDMESIQNAYQGFAKQNYAMLDNLKLGYGGTKSEMERLLKKANEINKQQGKITQYSIENYADIVDAIHVVQEEMGITGTTAIEAATTIQGSANMIKAAWQNWLTGLGDSEADMSDLTAKLFGSAKTWASNVLPVAKNVLTALADALQKDGPEIIGEAFQFAFEQLPDLTSTAVSLLTGIMDGIIDNLPLLLSAGVDMALEIGLGLVAAIPQLVAKVPELISAITETIVEKLPEIKEAGGKILEELQSALDEADLDIDLESLIDTFTALEPVIMAVVAALVAYKTAMAITSVISRVKSAMTAFTTAGKAATVGQAALNAVMNANPFVLVAALVAGLVAAVITLWNTNEGFRSAVTGIWSGIKSAFVSAYGAIVSTWSGAGAFFRGIWSDITGAFSSAYSIGSKIVGDIKAGISNAWSGLKSWFTNLWDGLFGNTKTVNVRVNKTTTEKTVKTASGATNSALSSRAIGLDYVPYNNYAATLHRGEAVLTSPEAEKWRKSDKEKQTQNRQSNENRHTVLNVYLSGKQIMQTVAEEARRETVRTGVNPLGV